MSVMFRRDRGSDRAEVVFELGRVRSGEPAHLGVYQARIYRGSTQLASVAVPEHYWSARWRWRSARRPVRVTTTSLIQHGLLPPYTAEAHAERTRPTKPQSYQPMRMARCRAIYAHDRGARRYRPGYRSAGRVPGAPDIRPPSPP